VRTDREVSLDGIVPHKAPPETAEGSGAKPPAAPTLRRPGEDNPSPGVPVTNKPDTRVPGAPDPQPNPAPPPAPPPPQALTPAAPAGS
jgi:hypothetical protein